MIPVGTAESQDLKVVREKEGNKKDQGENSLVEEDPQSNLRN